MKLSFQVEIHIQVSAADFEKYACTLSTIPTLLDTNSQDNISSTQLLCYTLYNFIKSSGEKKYVKISLLI